MISREALARFGAKLTTAQPKPVPNGASRMEGYLAKYSFDMVSCQPWNAQPGGLIYELSRCPFNPDHTDGSAAFTLVDGKPGFSCKHNGCYGKTIKDVFTLCPPDPPEDEADGYSVVHAHLIAAIDQIPSVWSYEATTSWLVEGLFPEAAITLVSGDSGVGKSTLALALAGAICRGERFLERATLKRRVLYLDRENPLAVVKDRLHRLGINETPDLIVWGGWVEPPAGGPAVPSIIQFARDYKPLLIFDSLVAFHTGSEQDASETRRHLQHYRTLAAAGATVVIIHHTGKADTAKQYRGSSDIKAAVDTAYVLESLSDIAGGIQSLRLTPFKNRLTVTEAVRIDYSGDRFLSAPDRAETNREILERLLRQSPGSGVRDLIALTKGMITKQRLLTLLDEGERREWLIVEAGPRGAKRYRVQDVVEVEI